MNHTPEKPARTNQFGQPIGFALPGWQAPPFPPHATLAGRYCRLEPLDAARHAGEIWEAQRDDPDGTRWTYSFHGPYTNLADYQAWCAGAQGSRDPQFYAIVAADGGRAVGTCTYMRIEPKHGVIEVGNIYFAPRLARTRAATEAMYLMMARVFDELGYRRYEWKCNALNAPSRAAAGRYGFRFEGIFRQADVVKGRNRDTAWFSIADSEWPGIKAAFERWLDPGNFDGNGRQRMSLSALTAR
jgi:RimJ/RimL family protein N-acetyltransferase